MELMTAEHAVPGLLDDHVWELPGLPSTSQRNCVPNSIGEPVTVLGTRELLRKNLLLMVRPREHAAVLKFR